jgi:hypothetical protein
MKTVTKTRKSIDNIFSNHDRERGVRIRSTIKVATFFFTFSSKKKYINYRVK